MLCVTSRFVWPGRVPALAVGSPLEASRCPSAALVSQPGVFPQSHGLCKTHLTLRIRNNRVTSVAELPIGSSTHH